jgi:guanylate kinase
LSCALPDSTPEPNLHTNRYGRHECRPLLIVLSGPSGVGKDAVLSRMKQSRRPFHRVVTATTRSRRANERDGVDYHFLSREEFQKKLSEDGFLEWAVVYGNYYGVLKEEIASALSRGVDVAVKVDVQGAATIKKTLPQAVFIFLTPPSMQELEDRLRSRLSESCADLAVRLQTAREEAKSLPLFDYIVVNHRDRLDDAVAQIDAIISAEKCRVKQRVVEL